VSLQAAVDRPRLHLQHLEDKGGIARLQLEAEEDLPLPATDLPIRLHHPHSMYFGGVGAALRLPSGQVQAAADPRRAGAVLVSPQP
jgi:gamma-glutamyltranspeptidase/glutathione hydrolase